MEQLYDRYQWIYEVHEIVAGAEKEALENASSFNRRGPGMSSKLWVQEVTTSDKQSAKCFDVTSKLGRMSSGKKTKRTNPQEPNAGSSTNGSLIYGLALVLSDTGVISISTN